MKNRDMRKRLLVIGGILTIAAALRLYNIGVVPLFFDESVHSVIVDNLLRGSYTYDPRFHGPLLFYTVAPIVATLGKSEFSLRLFPAIIGIALVASVFLYRRYLGDRVYIAALLVAVSPVIVNYSRFYRGDIYQLLFTSLAIYFLLRYFETEKNWKDTRIDKDTLYLTMSAICLGLFASVKETFYVFAAMLLFYFVYDLKKIRVTDLTLSSAIFLLIYATLYTGFFSDTTVITNLTKFPAAQALSYWYGQHKIARIGGPWYYHLEILLLYDFPALCLAIYAIYILLKGKDQSSFTRVMAYLFLANLLFYSYMQEKVPWLAVHIEFPMFMLAAKSVRDKKIIVLTVAFLFYGCLMVNIVNPVNPAEPALYLPTQYDVKESTAEFPDSARVCLYTSIGEYFPLVFYLKNWYMGNVNPPI